MAHDNDDNDDHDNNDDNDDNDDDDDDDDDDVDEEERRLTDLHDSAGIGYYRVTRQSSGNQISLHFQLPGQIP